MGRVVAKQRLTCQHPFAMPRQMYYDSQTKITNPHELSVSYQIAITPISYQIKNARVEQYANYEETDQ